MLRAKKLNDVAFLSNAIYLLQHQPHTLKRLHEMTNTLQTDASESCLFEHPSLVHRDGRMVLAEFAEIGSRQELLAHLQAAYPRPFRRVHLLGLYPYVQADVDDMLSRGDLVCIDRKSATLVAAACVRPAPPGAAFVTSYARKAPAHHIARPSRARRARADAADSVRHVQPHGG